MQKIPVWIEQIALLRAIGSVHLKTGTIDASGKASVISRLDALNAAMSAATDMNQALKRSGESISNEQEAALKISQKFAESVQLNFLGEQLKGDPSHYFNEATLTIEQTLTLQNRLFDRLETLLNQRVASFNFTMKLIIFH